MQWLFCKIYNIVILIQRQTNYTSLSKKLTNKVALHCKLSIVHKKPWFVYTGGGDPDTTTAFFKVYSELDQTNSTIFLQWKYQICKSQIPNVTDTPSQFQRRQVHQLKHPVYQPKHQVRQLK